jgi:hypothetical protein
MQKLIKIFAIAAAWPIIVMAARPIDIPDGTPDDGYVYRVELVSYLEIFNHGLSPRGSNDSVIDVWLGDSCTAEVTEPNFSAFVMFSADRHQIRDCARHVSASNASAFVYRVRLTQYMYNLRRSIQHAETATLTADWSGIHQAVEPEVWVAAGNVAGEDIESVEIFYDGSLIETRENRPPLFTPGYSNARPFINANPYGGGGK